MGYNGGVFIPPYIKIAGVRYQVTRDIMADQGNIMFNLGIIKINDNLCQDKAEETLCHEIIEAINEANELELPHHKIQIIGSMLHQVLKDNEMNMYIGES